MTVSCTVRSVVSFSVWKFSPLPLLPAGLAGIGAVQTVAAAAAAIALLFGR